jgi:hypothetical protein
MEAALSGLCAAAPFIIHAREPAQWLQELVAKGRFQPGEVFTLGRPFANPLQMTAPFGAERSPLRRAVADFNATADKIARLCREGEVRTSVKRGPVTEGTVFLAKHFGEEYLVLSIQSSVFSPVRSRVAALSSVDERIFAGP